MKKFLIVVLVFVCASTSWANPKEWFDSHSDTFAHVFAGGFFAGLAYKQGANTGGMVLTAASVGVLKEAFDLYYAGKWDNWDIFATVLGGVVFAAL